MLRLAYALAIGTWLGAVIALTFVVTPTAHGEFPTAEARRFLRPLFPRLYALGIGCGFLALLAVLAGKPALSTGELLRLALPTAVALACTIVGRQTLLPRLARLEGQDARFARLHQWSTMLNTTTLGALVLAMAAAIAR
jgi:hypothetical protein